MKTLSFGNLEGPEVAGCLQYKSLLKWVKVWCLIKDGLLLSFRTRSPQAFPMMTVPLNECTLSLVASDKAKKQQHVFKLCQLSARTMYFAATDMAQYTQWLNAMKEHAIFCDKVPVDVSPGHSMDSALSGDSSSLPSTGSGVSQGSVSKMDTSVLPGVLPAWIGHNNNYSPFSVGCATCSQTHGFEHESSCWTESYLRSLPTTCVYSHSDVSNSPTFQGSDVADLEEVTTESEGHDMDSDLESPPLDLESKYVSSSSRYDISLKQVRDTQ